MTGERTIYGDVLVASVTFVGACILLRWLKQSGAKDAGKRYPPSLPALQMVHAILRGGMSVLPEQFMRVAEKLGPIFCVKIAGRMVVVLSDYESIFSAMVKQSETFADRGSVWIENNVMNPELKGISFIPYADRYRKNHKLVLAILREFGFGTERVMETRILQEVETMNEEIVKQDGRPFYPKWTYMFSASNVVMSILFGKTFLQSLPNEHSTIVESASTCISQMDLTINIVPVVRFLPNFRRKVECMRVSCERLLNSIETGIRFVKKSPDSEATFIGRYLEIHGTDYDHENLRYILRDLCFGSTETVSTVLEWVSVELANHPEVQKRIQKEIDEMVPGDRLPSLDDKPRLPYTDAFTLELLRRHTIAPFFVPHSPLKDTKLFGYDIPQGCVVLPNGYSVHMDPKIWKDPEHFRPERFLDNDDGKISEKVVAFGLGKRSCIGEILARQSTFLFLTSLVQRFDIRPPEGQDTIQVKELTALTTAPSHFEVRLIRRVKPTQA